MLINLNTEPSEPSDCFIILKLLDNAVPINLNTEPSELNARFIILPPPENKLPNIRVNPFRKNLPILPIIVLITLGKRKLKIPLTAIIPPRRPAMAEIITATPPSNVATIDPSPSMPTNRPTQLIPSTTDSITVLTALSTHVIAVSTGVRLANVRCHWPANRSCAFARSLLDLLVFSNLAFSSAVNFL